MVRMRFRFQRKKLKSKKQQGKNKAAGKLQTNKFIFNRKTHIFLLFTFYFLLLSSALLLFEDLKTGRNKTAREEIIVQIRVRRFQIRIEHDRFDFLFSDDQF